jgi:hypothetical protein
MNLRKFGLLGILLLLGSGAAESYDEAYQFDCDAPQGRYSQVQIPLGEGAAGIDGILVVNETREDKRYIPTAAIVIGREDHESSVGIIAAVFREFGEKLTLHAQGSTPEDRAEFGSLDWEGKELPFRLEWASEGRMKVKVGIKSGGVDFQRQTGAKLFVSCSTGDFSFKNVRVLSRSTK